MEDLPTDIRERLRLEIRLAMTRDRITGRSLSRMLGITPQGFSRLVSGTSVSDTSTLQRVLELLGYEITIEVKKK